MVVEVVRSYWEVASGLTDVTRQRAVATARSVLSGDGVDLVVPGALGQVQSLADELVALSKSNRDLLSGIVSAEVDRALGLMGLATRDEVHALQRSVDRLTSKVDALASGGPTAAPPKPTHQATKKPTKKPARKPSQTSTSTSTSNSTRQAVADPADQPSDQDRP